MLSRRPDPITLLRWSRSLDFPPSTRFAFMSYGVKWEKIVADAASYVDRILRGANPAELPVQAPTEFEFILNQTAARQLGVQLPPTLLARADEVIE